MLSGRLSKRSAKRQKVIQPRAVHDQSLLLYCISLYLAVMSLKKATVENAKGLHICCTNGDSHATIMTVQCPKTFNLCVIVNHESLNRLCVDKVLDDQVSKDCMENKLFHVLLTPILINWVHSLQAINALLSLLVYDYERDIAVQVSAAYTPMVLCHILHTYMHL